MNSAANQSSAYPSSSTTPDQEMVGESTVNDQEEPHQLVGTGNTFEDDDMPENGLRLSNLQAFSGSLLHGIPAALSVEITQLLTKDQLVVMQSLFQSHLPSSIGNPEIPIHGCCLLSMIPIECRKQIWEYLLFNPLLGECFAADNNRAKFKLFPTILRVNKQVYNEGMDILYGSNTFLIECIPHPTYNFGTGRVTFCALTRSQQLDRAARDGRGDDSIIPAAKYVRHWKVVVSARMFDPPRENGLLSFCRNVYLANIQSLEVLIVPHGIEMNWDLEHTYGDEHQLAITLSPLERLRNVGRFTIRLAEFHEIPSVAFFKGEWLSNEFTPILPSPVDEVRLVTLVEGNSEVERIEEMYKNLLTYAQTFEQIEEFKTDMDIDREDIECSGFDICETGYSTVSTPYKFAGHPVESNLSAAKASMVRDNMEEFKSYRSAVIKYLEPQYQVIEAASKSVVDFIKAHKTESGLFDPSNHESPEVVDTASAAMVFLEEYETSFARKLDTHTKIAIRKQKLIFNARYEALPRAQAMKFCAMAYEKQWWNRFVKHFREAVNGMDVQYLGIREARKNLYAWDLESTIREIDAKPMLCDEMINWDVCEKDMRVNEQNHEYRHYPEIDTSLDQCDGVGNLFGQANEHAGSQNGGESIRSDSPGNDDQDGNFNANGGNDEGQESDAESEVED
ncbi:hypothetical protein EAF04_000678 [Stromatinia cepivora]|nr:hypothetical protein EAF04_000678 [Stromatinia cepivora]